MTTDPPLIPKGPRTVRISRSRQAICTTENGEERAYSYSTFFWSKQSGVKLHFIQPGKPTRYAFVESFNGKFREYCLDLHWFASLEDARSTNGKTTTTTSGYTAHWAVSHLLCSPG